MKEYLSKTCAYFFIFIWLLPCAARSQDGNATYHKINLHDYLLSKGYVAVPLLQDDEGGCFKIECKIGSEKIVLLLDTGAERSSIDKNLAKKLGLESKGEVIAKGIEGTRTGFYSAIRSISIGSFDTRELANEFDVAVFDFSSLQSKISGQKLRKIDGLIGSSALTLCSGIIDYPQKTLYLRTPLRSLWPEIEGRWTATEFTIDGQKKPFDEKNTPRLRFKDRRMMISNGTDEVEYGIHVALGKDYSTLVLFPPEKEKNDTLIYTAASLLKVSGDKMTVCLSLEASKGIPNDFKAPAGSGFMLLELKKEK